MVSLLSLRVAFHFYAKQQEDSVWLSHTSKTHKQHIAAIRRKTLLEAGSAPAPSRAAART